MVPLKVTWSATRCGKEKKIAVAFNVQFKDMRDWVCIDSGTNKLILMNNSGWNNYIRVIDDFFENCL